MHIVFYHGPYCADGLASRWVAYMKWPNAHFIPFGTNECMTDEHKEMCRSKDVLFVDVAPNLSDIAWLYNNSTLTIYDHHYSTMQLLKCSGYISKIHTVLSQQMCGCHIIWTQCFPHQPLPWVLRYIESRDLWKFKNKNEQIISWIISSNVISTYQTQTIADTYSYLNSLYKSKGWLWNPSHSDRWSVYQTKLYHIMHNNVKSGFLTTPNHMMVRVQIIKTKYLWMASDMMEILKSKGHSGLFMFIHERKMSPNNLPTSVITLRGVAALSVAQQWPNGGGHLMAAGFKTFTTELESRISYENNL
jgi:hypothetical protein